MRRSIIAAVAANGVIGCDNRLPWRLSADLRRFKQLTLDHDLIMGRRTFESIGRPLPGRRTIVLTRDPAYARDGVLLASSIDDAFTMARGDEVFIAGGAEVYRETLARTDRLYLTLIEQAFEGDATFPSFVGDDWDVVEEEAHRGDAWGYRFVVFDRKGASK